MSENKKYYYLKLKDNFFNSDAMIVLESMPDGYKYSNILLKLYLRSLPNDGKLMFNHRIPYNSTVLAQVTRHSIGDVEKALHIFKELDLIEILDNGAIYMLDIQNFIGSSSTEADRIRAYRKRIDEEKNIIDKGDVQMYGQMYTRDRDRDRDKDKDIKSADADGESASAQKRRDDFEKLWKLYPKKQRKQDAFKAYEKAIKKGVTNEEIQEGIVKYKENLKNTGTKAKFIAQGGTWFNQERWNDEYDTDDYGEELEKGRYYDEIGF